MEKRVKIPIRQAFGNFLDFFAMKEESFADIYEKWVDNFAYL